MALTVVAKCSHFPQCGGCAIQQLDYADQLILKQAQVEKLFPSFPVEEIIPCESPWEYRNKMEFSFSQNKAGDYFLGLILARTRGHVFNLTECHLVSSWMANLVNEVRAWWIESRLKAFHMHKNTGTLRTLIVREGKRTQNKLIMLTVSGNPEFAPSQKQLNDFLACIKKVLPEDNVSVFLRVQQQIKGQPTQFYEMNLSGPDHIQEILHIYGKALKFKISPTSFFQPNTYQAEKLYTAALDMISDKPREVIYDLYSGTATLSMILAGRAKKVIAIELNPHALFDAQWNLEENGIENVELICGDVGEKLKELPLNPDLVVVDPPRAGLSPKAIEHLLHCKPKEILYISCNPVTQAENLKILCQAGYQLVKVQPVDQFPHTLHIENISYLRLFP